MVGKKKPQPKSGQGSVLSTSQNIQNVIRYPVLLSALSPINLKSYSHLDLAQGFKG
jgi:hypothetical protein